MFFNRFAVGGLKEIRASWNVKVNFHSKILHILLDYLLYFSEHISGFIRLYSHYSGHPLMTPPQFFHNSALKSYKVQASLESNSIYIIFTYRIAAPRTRDSAISDYKTRTFHIGNLTSKVPPTSGISATAYSPREIQFLHFTICGVSGTLQLGKYPSLDGLRGSG